MPNPGTRLETDDDIQRALMKYRPPVTQAGAPVATAPADDAPPLYHPTERPGIAVLTVFDDGSDDGEQMRIRKDEFVLGRTTGDYLIPHDGQMSGRHAAIRRELKHDKLRWYLVDLNSTNGTYVRVGHALLQHGQQFIIGRTRIRFDDPPPAEAAKPTTPEQTTRPWQSGPQLAIAPSLVLLDQDGPGTRLLLAQTEAWLGKDPAQCQWTLPDDPFVSARHARVFRDEQGRWAIENNRSPNGVWLCVERIRIERSCHFLLGEQRFRVVVPR